MLEASYESDPYKKDHIQHLKSKAGTIMSHLLKK